MKWTLLLGIGMFILLATTLSVATQRWWELPVRTACMLQLGVGTAITMLWMVINESDPSLLGGWAQPEWSFYALIFTFVRFDVAPHRSATIRAMTRRFVGCLVGAGGGIVVTMLLLVVPDSEVAASVVLVISMVLLVGSVRYFEGTNGGRVLFGALHFMGSTVFIGYHAMIDGARDALLLLIPIKVMLAEVLGFTIGVVLVFAFPITPESTLELHLHEVLGTTLALLQDVAAGHEVCLPHTTHHHVATATSALADVKVGNRAKYKVLEHAARQLLVVLLLLVTTPLSSREELVLTSHAEKCVLLASRCLKTGGSCVTAKEYIREYSRGSAEGGVRRLLAEALLAVCEPQRTVQDLDPPSRCVPR